MKSTYTHVSHKDPFVDPSKYRIHVTTSIDSPSSKQDRATAVAKFADFWAANKDGEPSPRNETSSLPASDSTDSADAKVP